MLTTRLLWYAIASFLRSWPLVTPPAIVQFDREEALKWYRWRYDQPYPKRVGLLPQAAVTGKSKKTLALLDEFVRANTRFKDHVKLQFGEVLRCAVHWGTSTWSAGRTRSCAKQTQSGRASPT